MLLTIKNLIFSRDYDYIFNGFQLKIDYGQWVVIRGKNGAGKSTLLKLIGGLLVPEEGDIMKSEIAFLGHENGQRSYLTVKEQLTTKKRLLDSMMDVDNLMVCCRIKMLADIKVGKLSAGQQRQVALAGVMLSSAPLWLLDEPFEHLDDEALELFHKMCHQHVQAGGAICQTSHGELPDFFNVQEIWLHA